LPAGLPDRINDFCLEPEQAQLKYLEKTTWSCPDDDDVCVDHAITPREIRALLS
jgi:hypothetical protein